MRMFNYGSIAPVFFLYCVAIGIDVQDTGILLTCILVGDLFITLFLSTRADRTIGRKRTLIVGALLKVAAGIGFALTRNFAVLVGTGIIGVISTSGGEIGPFVAIEQAIVTDSVVNAGGSKSDVPILFGYYNAFGYFFQALGALASGLTVHLLQKYTSFSDLDAYRFVFYSYALFGIFMAFAYSLLSSNAEIAELNENTALKQSSTPTTTQPTLPASSQGCFDFGLRRPESKFIVVRLSIMFMLDAFAGAFVMQTWIAFWFERKFEFSADLIGYLLMASNVVSGISGIAASYVVQKVGAMLTMVPFQFFQICLQCLF
jgi:predicted MFS family arabinose efflux permease